MKKYIRADQLNTPTHVVVTVEIDTNDFDSHVAAATYTKQDHIFQIPDGALLPRDKVVIDPDSQIVADYESFIESVVDLIEDYYDLHVYYKNKSKDYSWYFGILAKDDNEAIILDFDFTLRLSNHSAHRTSDSQEHKKERRAELLKTTGGKKTKPIVKSILVNDHEFKTYLEAYTEVDRIIESTVAILRRN